MVWDGEGGMSKSATLDEFFEKDVGNSNLGGSGSHELRFTGNWFIDAGILGFVNLMEVVYGWDLDELQKIMNETSEEKLLSLFTYAFWYKVIMDTIKRWLNKDIFKEKELKKSEIDPQTLKENITKSISNNILQKNEELKKYVIETYDAKNTVLKLNEFVKNLIVHKFQEYQYYLKKVFAQNKKTLLDQVKSVGIIGYNDFFTNLSIFNPSSNIAGKEKNILTAFERLIFEGFVRKDKKIKDLPTDVLDKALSPFIYSASDFHNEYYGRPMTLRLLESIVPTRPVIYLLSIPFSFVWILSRNYLFYAPDIKFAYYVNKKLRYYTKNIDPKTDKKRKILEITWNAILDTLIEYKSQYSLENMYILEFSGIQNQQIQDVEYLGISKLQASILIEDPIREALNVNLPIDKDERNKNKDKSIWILKEFIKNKPLYDLISRHVFYCLREKNEKNIRRNRKASLYALAIDAKIKENNRIDLFSDKFFEGYRSLVNEIKDCYSTLNSNAIKISQLFNSLEERRQISYTLVSALKKRNRIALVNTLLKKFLENAGSEEVLQLSKFVFENIVSNDDSWENYALALVIGILSGGEVESDESESEE